MLESRAEIEIARRADEYSPDRRTKDGELRAHGSAAELLAMFPGV